MNAMAKMKNLKTRCDASFSKTVYAVVMVEEISIIVIYISLIKAVHIVGTM